MSLVAPRPQDQERSSVLLPSITCSSCSAPIPLSSLGDHVCRPPSRSTGVRAIPRPSQITIPANKPFGPSSGSSWNGPTSVSSDSSPNMIAGPSNPRPRPSPGNLAIPPRSTLGVGISPNGNSLSPGGYMNQPRTPSPTNPFFPHPEAQAGVVVHGLGLGVGTSPRREGPYPTDAPLPVGLTAPGIGGGEAGMAGVGRRAFAAAAWGVTAGLSMAAGATRSPMPGSGSQHGPSASPASSLSVPSPFPARNVSSPNPTPRSISPQPPAQQIARPEHQQRPTVTMPTPAPTPIPASAPDSRPQFPSGPSAPLANRQRSGPAVTQIPPRSESRAASIPERSTSAMSQRSQGAKPELAQVDNRRKDSVSSVGSSRSGGDSISQLLKARSAESSSKPAPNLPFFEKYKQYVNAQSTDGGALAARRGSRESGQEVLVASPEHTTLRIQDDDDDDDQEGSSLPWATPNMGQDASPLIIQRPQHVPARIETSRLAHRYHTAESEASSATSTRSSRSGPFGTSGSGPETEEVVTPSQSWEGSLTDRMGGGSHIVSRHAPDYSGKFHGLGIGMDARDGLEQIGEEEDEDDEADRVVLGTLPASMRKGSGPARHAHTSSQESVNTVTRPSLSTSGHEHTRSRTVPDIHRRPSEPLSSTSASAAGGPGQSLRRKTCQKCGEGVGGSKRFVERDGIVLCERDWKKLYLPSCRRCNLPIEKSAVSSSDGQLKGKWHRACFTCTRCDEPFEGDSFYVLGGKPWCQHHYHEENGTLCSAPTCGKPIEGPCILTPHPSPQRYHPGHLRCDHRAGLSGAQTCREPMEEYYEVKGGRYCERHVSAAMKVYDGNGNASADFGGRLKAEKRRTKLVELPKGALGY